MGGAEYSTALLHGYTGVEKEEAGVTLYENKAFPGGWISMGPPLEHIRRNKYLLLKILEQTSVDKLVPRL